MIYQSESGLVIQQSPTQRQYQAELGTVVCEFGLVDYPPTSDVSAGGWTPSTGVNLYAMIDEASPDDSDYDLSAILPVADSMEVAFANVATPVAVSDHHIKYRIKGDGAVKIVVALRQGTTTIKSWTHDPAPNTFTTYDQVLTGAEASSITDYSQLRLKVTAN